MTDVVTGQLAARLVTLGEGQTFNEVILNEKDLLIALNFCLFHEIGF